MDEEPLQPVVHCGEKFTTTSVCGCNQDPDVLQRDGTRLKRFLTIQDLDPTRAELQTWTLTTFLTLQIGIVISIPA